MSSTRSSAPWPRITTSCSRCWKHRCHRPGSSSERVSSLERGLYAAPALLEKFGEPRTLEDLARLPMLTGPNDAPWALTTPAGVTEHLDGSEGAAGQFERRHPAAGGARRARRAAGDGELYQRGGRSGIAAADPHRSCLRAAQYSCAAAGPPIRSRKSAMLPRCAGRPWPGRRNGGPAKSKSLTSEVNP